MKNPRLLVFIAIFMLSGFSGLIYESIWSHYLKLLLGHASYAQVLVLGIFMGGMAIGSFGASRIGGRLSNLILWYGVVELLIGLSAVVFHSVFVEVQGYVFGVILPATDTVLGAQLAKWGVGALLILPQSILLGATFPLLAAGIIRKFPSRPGNALGALYFSNSFGAAIGILCNSFIILPAVGLPGSILTAGLINIFIAVVVYRLVKGDAYPAESGEVKPESNIGKYLLITAALTGLASFLYEIAWIRMLTMVLGGSSHSFEIMLAAFILGLALGGLWIRNRLDSMKQPLVTLARIQMLMGAFAALTIPLYGYVFELMGFGVNALARTDQGYSLYLSLSLFLSLLVMLPTTICAGTTLPIISYILLNKKAGDSAIGRVYAWNTVGAILGIVLASQLIMPLLGLQMVVLVGASVDILLSCYLFFLARQAIVSRKTFYAFSIVAILTLVSVSTLSFDVKKMSSGVFRNGLMGGVDNSEIVFHKDGKTSTVAVRRFGDTQAIVNNGKPDAAINVNTDKSNNLISGDEPTMVLLGTLPFVYDPDAKLIANIGMGSGMTAHSMLLNPEVEQVDTIEIEKEVYNGARYFGEKVERAFTDPRSNVVFEDAKTYFASSQKLYDVIVSEPPNPWVSGVSGLFTTEFYRDVKQYMKPGAVLVQWMHIYELNDDLLATVYRALTENFSDIHIYRVGPGDLAFVVSENKLEASYDGLFGFPEFNSQLKMVGVENPDDLRFRRLSTKPTLDAVFESYAVSTNSDFFPVLDYGASKARFKKEVANGVLQLRTSSLLRRVTGESEYLDGDPTPAGRIENIRLYLEVQRFFKQLQAKLSTEGRGAFLFAGVGANSSWMAAFLGSCGEDLPQDKLEISSKLIRIIEWMFRFSTAEQSLNLLSRIEACNLGRLDSTAADWVMIHKYWLEENYNEVFELSHNRIKIVGLKEPLSKRLVAFNLAAQIMQGRKASISYLVDQNFFDLFKSDLELRGLINLYSKLPEELSASKVNTQ